MNRGRGKMYSATVAEQLRARRHDVVSIHDAEFRSLEGAPDEEVFAAAIAEERAIVTENVPDFRRLEADARERRPNPRAHLHDEPAVSPGNPATVGRLVLALDALLAERPTRRAAHFLKPLPSS